jgi:hypothetical protein
MEKGKASFLSNAKMRRDHMKRDQNTYRIALLFLSLTLIVTFYGGGTALIASAAGGAVKTGIVPNERFLQRKGQTAWKTIAVLPFTGPPQHARVFSEYFSVQLLQQHRYIIVSPALFEIELNKRGSPLAKGIRNIQEAREAGQLLGADAVIMGSVDTDYSFQLVHGEGIVRTRLIDTATGEQVAEITRASPVLFTTDQHRHMTVATEGAAADMLSVLRLLSGEPVSQPAGTTQSDEQNRVP